MKIKNINFVIVILLFFFTENIFSQTGQIRGKVFDKTSHLPVSFANVSVEGTSKGTQTDTSGSFFIQNINPGFVRLSVNFIGYKNLLSEEIQVLNHNSIYVELFAEIAANQLDEVVIEVSPFVKNIETPVSVQKITISDIENNPGSNRDFSKVIQSFPGVASNPSFRNDIIIRGGGPSENVFILDDVEIPNINHFATQGASGGAVGIINADLLKDVNFYAGAFPADRSNVLSSVFELKLIDGNKDKSKFRFSLGASEMSGTADGPIGKKTSYIFSIRRSYLQFLFQALKLPFLPTFTDYQYKVKTKLSSNLELTLIGIGALDENNLNTELKNQTEQQQNILAYLPYNKQWTYTTGAVLKKYTTTGTHSFTLSRNMFNNISYKYPDNNEALSKIYDYKSQEIENKIRYENVYNKNDYKVTTSINSEYVKYSNNTNQSIFVNNEAVSKIYITNIEFFKYGLSANAAKSFFSNKFDLNFGLRIDGNNFSNSMQNPLNQLSPRISARYSITNKLGIGMNMGRYFRLPAYTSLGFRNSENILANKSVTYIQCDHYVLGMDYSISKNTFISVESFLKNYSKYPVSTTDSISLSSKGADFGVIGDEQIKSTGIGKSYGIEVLFRTKIRNKLNLILSYTYAKSETEDKNGKFVPTSWDGRNTISTTFTYNFNNNWSIGGKWRYSGGFPYTAYDLEKSAYVQAWDVQGRPFLDYSQFNALRFTPFHQLDLRIDKKYFFKNWSMMFYLDIQNLYNFQSQEQDFVIREKDANGNFILTDNNTKYKLKTLESASGTVLPTIGIMIEF